MNSRPQGSYVEPAGRMLLTTSNNVDPYVYDIQGLISPQHLATACRRLRCVASEDCRAANNKFDSKPRSRRYTVWLGHLCVGRETKRGTERDIDRQADILTQDRVKREIAAGAVQRQAHHRAIWNRRAESPVAMKARKQHKTANAFVEHTLDGNLSSCVS